MAVALAQDGAFGFAVQSAKGQFATPTVWLPLMSGPGGRGESVQWKKNYVTLDLADNNDYESRYFSVGEWAEGDLILPLVPGSLTALLSWVQDRDANSQGKWASLVIDCVNEVKKVTDAKVRRMRLELVKGQPINCVLEIVALKMESGSPVSVNMPTAAPYLYREATVSIASGGGNLTEDVDCERISLVVDNMVEVPADGLRLTASEAPQELYNLSGVRCRGVISRDFVDNNLYADFAAGTEAALSVTLARGAVSASVTLPRVLYVEDQLSLPGSHEQRLVETVQFVALGSVDGLTPPVVLV